MRDDGQMEMAGDLGRLYEVAFNVGAMTAISRSGVECRILDHYRADMKIWKLGGAIEGMMKNAEVVDAAFEKVARHAAEYLFTKGYMGGLLFMEEYLRRVKPRPHTAVELLYFGCDFDGKNSFGLMKADSKAARERSLETLFGRTLAKWEVDLWKGAGGKGEFLHADCLALFKVGRRKPRHRILSVDFSAFSGGELLRSDIAEPESQRKALARELYAIRAKSVFSGLYIDTGSPGSESTGKLSSTAHIPEGLRDYMGAFKYRDKEVVKVVQAGAYAHSFYEALLGEGRLAPSDEVRFTCVGHTDRDSVSISVGECEREILATCHRIYKTHDAKRGIPVDRKRVLGLIASNAAAAFEGGGRFVEEILNLPESTKSLGRGGNVRISHGERLEGFARPQSELSGALLERLGFPGGIELREAHRLLITRALGEASKDLYVFLTGSPGIGKTTSIVSFLEDHADEGFMFLYVSPRKQVNRDIAAKFTKDGHPDGLLCLTSSREVVDEGGSAPTVEFRADEDARRYLLENRELSGVRFLDEARPGVAGGGRTGRVETRDTGAIVGKDGGGVGVLHSLFKGMNAVIEKDLSRNVVATAAIQALKKTRSGDTLRHLPEMFRTVLKDGREPMPEKMRELSGRVKHVFVMVDEITGDSAGAEFLSKVGEELRSLGLTDEEHGFNTKIIVADASVVDKDVIRQHLSESGSEPDKIFFRTASGAEDPLTVESFKYKKFPASVINADCYPARGLDVSYELLCEASPFDAEREPGRREISDAALASIADDVVEGAGREGQMLVYIQDKGRISRLIEAVRARLADRNEAFEKPDDYIEIHANLPRNEEKAVESRKDRAKVVFMTSSASRGLSFRNTRSILVEMPRFSLEQNLMELIQVIFRGRGCDEVDGMVKSLRFYVSESVFFDEGGEGRDEAVREGAMGLLTFLVVLKTSIMTRISGSGRIGDAGFLMVPVGGKSVSFAGESHSEAVASFLKSLSAEIRRDPRRGHSLRKDVLEPVESLFDSGSFVVRRSPWARAAEGFRSKFLDRAGRSLEGLFERPPLEYDGGATGASAVGSLLVVPYHADGLEEEYALRAARSMGRDALEKLRKRLWAIRMGEEYPEDLRIKCAAPLDIIEEVLRGDGGRSQDFEQKTTRPDRYYALPIPMFVFGERLAEGMRLANSSEGGRSGERDRGFASFRHLLEGCLRNHFPLEGVLPIGVEYDAFPFLLFNSYNLEELRSKLFAENQMLASKELNVLNLILAKE